MEELNPVKKILVELNERERVRVVSKSSKGLQVKAYIKLF